MFEYLEKTKSFSDRTGTEKGNAAASISQSAKTFENTYRWPFQMHAMIGPSCAVADVRGDKATVWSGSQAPFITRNGVARLLGIPEHNVHYIYTEGSGCYGRLEPDDAPEDAALMSRAVGKPVRVQWTRADEHGWEPKGPPQLISIRSGIDSQGKVLAWQYNERTLSWTDCRMTPMLASRQTGIKPDVNGVFLGGNDGGALQLRKSQSGSRPAFRGSCPPIRCAPATSARHTVRRDALPPNRKWTRWPPRQMPIRSNIAFAIWVARTASASWMRLRAVTAKAQWQARPSPQKARRRKYRNGTRPRSFRISWYGGSCKWPKWKSTNPPGKSP